MCKGFCTGRGWGSGWQSVKNFYILKYNPDLFFGPFKNILLLSSSCLYLFCIDLERSPTRLVQCSIEYFVSIEAYSKTDSNTANITSWQNFKIWAERKHKILITLSLDKRSELSWSRLKVNAMAFGGDASPKKRVERTYWEQFVFRKQY